MKDVQLCFARIRRISSLISAVETEGGQIRALMGDNSKAMTPISLPDESPATPFESSLMKLE